jgi:oligosaccharide repeat unit polymerase
MELETNIITYLLLLTPFLVVLAAGIFHGGSRLSFSLAFPVIFFIYTLFGPLVIILGDDSFFWRDIYSSVIDFKIDNLWYTMIILNIYITSWACGFYIFKGWGLSSVNYISERRMYGIEIKIALLFSIIFGGLYVYFGFFEYISSIGLDTSVYRNLKYIKSGTIVNALHPIWGASLVTFFILMLINGWKYSSVFVKVMFFLLSFFYMFVSFILGDRGQLILLFFGVLTGLFRLKSSKIRFLAFISGFLFLSLLVLIKKTRGLSFSSIDSEIISDRLDIFSVLIGAFSNAENIASFISIYFFTSEDHPLLYGESIFHTLISFIPRVLYPDRPGYFFYQYYSDLINLPEGRGYTVSELADWYANFGVFGIALGGVILGIFMRGLELKSNFPTKKGAIYTILSILVLSWIPQLLRTGIEGYKALVYENLIVVIVVFTLATMYRKIAKKKKSNSKKKLVTKNF